MKARSWDWRKIFTSFRSEQVVDWPWFVANWVKGQTRDHQRVSGGQLRAQSSGFPAIANDRSLEVQGKVVVDGLILFVCGGWGEF